MALSRHIPMTSDLVFPAEAYAVGGVEQVIDFDASTREQRVQAHDRDSGLPLWAISVFDADPDARAEVVRVKISARNPPTLPPAGCGVAVPGGRIRGSDGNAIRRHLGFKAEARLVVPGDCRPRRLSHQLRLYAASRHSQRNHATTTARYATAITVPWIP